MKTSHLLEELKEIRHRVDKIIKDVELLENLAPLPLDTESKTKQQFEGLAWIVAKYFHVSMDDLLGLSREKHIVYPRHVLSYLTRTLLHLSYPYTAKLMSSHRPNKTVMDHSTVIHACETVIDSCNCNTTATRDIAIITEQFQKHYEQTKVEKID